MSNTAEKQYVVISRNEARNMQMVRELQEDGRWKTKHIPIDPSRRAAPRKKTAVNEVVVPGTDGLGAWVRT